MSEPGLSADTNQAYGIKTDWRDWLLTIIHRVVFLAILLIFDLIQRLAIIFGRRAHELAIVGLNRMLVWSLRIPQVTIRFEGDATLEPGKSYIIVSNHQSLFDIPIIHSLFASHRPRFIAKQELSRWIPSVSFNLRHGGNAIIDRSNAKQAIAEIERLGKLITDWRYAGVIFPEGTRAKDGEIKKFRYAGLASMLQTAPDAIIVPVTIDGSWRLVPPKGSPIPRRQTVIVSVAPHIPRTQHDSLKKLISEIEGVVAGNLQRIRECAKP